MHAPIGLTTVHTLLSLISMQPLFIPFHSRCFFSQLCMLSLMHFMMNYRPNITSSLKLFDPC